MIDPAEQVRTYVLATEEAMAAGFTGLRVATDATALVRTPRQLAAAVRYEHLVDHYMAAHPFSALCCYNGTELDDRTIAQLACVHPTINVTEPRFRLHGPSVTGCVASLSGVLDVTNLELFQLALERVAPLPTGDGTLVIDGTGLTFMDHNSLIRLIEHAVRHAATLVLRTSWPGAARIVTALNLPNVRFEPVG